MVRIGTSRITHADLPSARVFDIPLHKDTAVHLRLLAVMTQVEPYAFRVDSLLRELRVLLIKETGNSVSNRLTPKTLVAVTSTYLFHSRSTRSLAAFAPADTFRISS